MVGGFHGGIERLLFGGGMALGVQRELHEQLVALVAGAVRLFQPGEQFALAVMILLEAFEDVFGRCHCDAVPRIVR